MLFVKMVNRLFSRIDEERGAVAGEYAVLLALIAVALVTAIGLFRDAIIRAFDAATGVLPA